LSLRAQYYLTGEVLDTHGDKLQNVSIAAHSTGTIYHSDIAGEFRILSRTMDDTLTFTVDGYDSYTTAVHTTGYLQVTLKMNSFSVEGGGRRRIFLGDSAMKTVAFTGATPRVSYGIIRRFLDMGSVVPPEAVKIEEMLNYFNFSYEEPGAKDIFHCSSDLLSCPWNGAHRLLLVQVCARKADIRRKPPANLVLLVDASGSMDMPNKLPLIKSGIRLLVDNLRDIDTISLVEFGSRVRVLFAGMPGSEKGRIMKAIEELRPDGPSPGVQGLKLAYDVAKQQLIPRGSNRVILLTDGDIGMEPPAAGTGTSEEQELEELIGQQSQAGIHLTCGGLGMKSVKDSRLPLLAEIGRGNFAYLDDEDMVEQLLAGELDPGLACVANKVSVAVDFNPALVKEYRLLGFDNKRGAAEDSAAGLEGSRIGSGNSLLALFELVPKVDTTGADTLARLRVNYCMPGQTSRRVMSYDCMNDYLPFDRANIDLKRAVCIALFGMKLQQLDCTRQVDWMDIEKMAKKIFTGSNYLDDEYIALIDRAKRIYEGRKE
jgi:Ca-activated chloride channel family protein